MLSRVLTASANAGNVARELVGDDAALGGLITMLASWEPPIRLAAVRALAKITWLVRISRKRSLFTQLYTPAMNCRWPAGSSPSTWPPGAPTLRSPGW